jgi:molecular chaperone DnaK
MSVIYGIDFGTRNTAVECSQRLTSAGGGTIPSAVAYDTLSDEIRFGEAAVELLRTQDVSLRERWGIATSFKTALATDSPFVRTGVGTKTAAGVLQDYFSFLVRHAKASGLPALEAAVFSIPVGFDALSRVRLLEAARGAGIEPVGIVSESTAAYLQLLRTIGAGERIAVVDWGAGTLDVSVLRVTSSGGLGAVIEESACEGSRIAGDRIDEEIYESLAVRARAEGRLVGPINEVPPQLLRAVLNACERAKIALSDELTRREKVSVVNPKFTDGVPATFEFKADELKAVSRSAVSQTFNVLDRSISDAGMSIAQVDRIIFVGGCTRIHGFREAATARYGPVATFPPDPEWVVSGGALQVAKGHASYESLQRFGCILDDGYFLPLNNTSEFNGRSNDVTVAATESTRVASLVFAEQQGSRTSMVGSLSVPLLGHMGEPVGIRTTMRRDLTVHVKAWSHCAREEQDAREMSIDNTRFRFRVKA